ncbi:MAG TPA: FKBP-type peptidyl-prolyl cis-trans isomerase [Pirellulales bacterium]|nr:FKBP-type peptidyl-prolyl cis-trans isomerase [Pirellulales bacterium]
MKVLFTWALSLALCAGVAFAAQPGQKKPKGSAPAKSNRTNDDESEKPARAAETGDEPDSDGAATDGTEENEGREGSADDDKPVSKSKRPVARGAKAKEIETIKKVSYLLGVELVRRQKGMGVDLVLDECVQGIEDAFAGKVKEFSEEEMKDLQLAMESIVAERQAEMMKEAGAMYKLEGEKYQAENKKKEGVKTTKTGLQYKVLKSGKGKSPKPTDTVTAHYKGTFIDGTEFQSSYKLGKPHTSPVNRFIPGWIEALQLMKVGDKWRIVVPSELAYRAQGMQDQNGRLIIPPNVTLIYELELLSIDASGDDE